MKEDEGERENGNRGDEGRKGEETGARMKEGWRNVRRDYEGGG